MGPESTGSNQQSASALSPQQVIDSSAKSNSVTQTNLTQSTPSPIGSSSGSQGNARVGDAKDVCSSTTDKNKNLNYVIQSQQQEARLASQQYQYQPKRSTVQPDHNQNHQQQQHHHQHLQAQESTYLASNQSHYYSCRTCGNQRPLCKCNSNQEIVSADSLSANFGSFSSAEAGSNQNQTAAGRQMGDRYQVDGSSSHNHRSTPHSSSTSSSSSISAALTTSGNANTITMIEHNYEQGGFKNHLQQQHQHDHNPHQQHTVHHHHHHNNNQYAHSQQVSSQADHHHHLHHQHPQLISGADALLASENHSHQLTYNYDEQDHQECGDSWATLALDSAGYHSENCSSHINHQNDHHHLSHQTNHANEHSMFDESSLRPGGVDLLGSADHHQQQHHHQQQQLIAPPSQQTYSHHTSLHKMAPPGGNSNDLSTKQSQRHHGATYSTLVPMPTANHHQHHHYQPMHEAYLCGQAESRDNGSENMYSTSDASNYYSDSSACNDPASYHDSSRNQHLHQDGYPTNQSATRFEMMAATTTTSNQQLHPSRQVQHHSPTLNSMSTQQQQQQQSTHLSSSSSYDHLQQLEQMQSYQQDQHRSQLKHSMSVDQFHNEHYSQQQQLYHTGTSQALIENNNHDQEQNAYKSLASVNDSGSCGEQPIQFSQQQDNQYPSSDLKTQSSNYSSLQQLTMNYDNHLNQVTTTTVSTDRTLLSASKGRTLKGRRGRPRKKGLRSKNKVNGKLWEFIRDLLLSDCTNPSFIRWERREDGVFKFVQSDKVAKMWGERKQNPKMTYEKLSRAMRYYYKSKVLLPVFGRRLVYKFGPNATGWLPEDNNNAHVF